MPSWPEPGIGETDVPTAPPVTMARRWKQSISTTGQDTNASSKQNEENHNISADLFKYHLHFHFLSKWLIFGTNVYLSLHSK